MSPLNSSNVDSQGIKFELNDSNGVRTATITNNYFNTGRNTGLFSYYVGKGFMIQSILHTNLYVDAHDVPSGAYSNVCMWQDTPNGKKNRSWTIDENGRLVSLKYPEWCCYITSTESSDDRITMKQISTLDPSDEKQYWGFDGMHIYLSSAPEKWWDLADGTNANGTFIALRQTEHSDARRRWRIIPDIRYNEYSSLTFKRGVMDTNGVIYKLTGMTSDAFTNNLNYSSITFPQHKLSEFNYQLKGFPSNLSEVVFRDKILYLNRVLLQTGILSLAYGNNMYVALSKDTIYYSSNKTQWNIANVSVSSRKKVSYINGKFIAIGDGNNIQYSNDGVNWINVSSPVSLVNDITYGNNLYVAVGGFGSGNVEYSLDLTSWTVCGGGGNELQAITYNSLSKNFCAVDKSGSFSSNIIWMSSDGKSWTKEYSSTNSLYCVISTTSNGFRAVGAGQYLYHISSWGNEGEVSDSNIFRSVATNGTDTGCVNVGVGDSGIINRNVWGTGGGFVSSGTTNNLTTVKYLNNNFVVCGNNSTILYSSNGLNWNVVDSTFTTANATDIIFDGSEYVVSFLDGNIYWFNFVTPPPYMINYIDFNVNSGKLIIGKNMYSISGGENVKYDESRTGFKVTGSTSIWDTVNVDPTESCTTNLIFSGINIDNRDRWSTAVAFRNQYAINTTVNLIIENINYINSYEGGSMILDNHGDGMSVLNIYGTKNSSLTLGNEFKSLEILSPKTVTVNLFGCNVYIEESYSSGGRYITYDEFKELCSSADIKKYKIILSWD